MPGNGDHAVTAFLHKSLLLFKLVFDKAAFLVKKESEFQNLCNLLEAILAYHRANGGKD